MDRGNGVVDKFSAGGEYVTQVSVAGRLRGIAVDTSGELWVSAEETTMLRYTSAAQNEFSAPRN